MAAAQPLAAKGRKLRERYRAMKEKASSGKKARFEIERFSGGIW
jgi:hypothetical protein